VDIAGQYNQKGNWPDEHKDGNTYKDGGLMQLHGYFMFAYGRWRFILTLGLHLDVLSNTYLTGK
jgi:hypothetical protein